MWISSLSGSSSSNLFQTADEYTIFSCDNAGSCDVNTMFKYNISDFSYSSSGKIYPVVSLTGGILVEKADGTLVVE